MPDDIPLNPTEKLNTFQFDHGCQFFCAGDDRFIAKVSEWCDAGVVQEWNKRCVLVTNADGVDAYENVDHNKDIIHKDFL